jgi:hypothetical protein
MASQDQLTNEILEAALIGLEQKKQQLEERIQDLKQRLGTGSAPSPAPTPTRAAKATSTPSAPASRGGRKRTMSAAARKRIAEAQRKRWAEYHARQQK